MVRTFHFYIDDQRWGEPQELVVQARDDARAREMADKMHAQSEHHLGVEVCEQGKRLFGVGSFAAKTWCEREKPTLPPITSQPRRKTWLGLR